MHKRSSKARSKHFIRCTYTHAQNSMHDTDYRAEDALHFGIIAYTKPKTLNPYSEPEALTILERCSVEHDSMPARLSLV